MSFTNWPKCRLQKNNVLLSPNIKKQMHPNPLSQSAQDEDPNADTETVRLKAKASFDKVDSPNIKTQNPKGKQQRQAEK